MPTSTSVSIVGLIVALLFAALVGHVANLQATCVAAPLAALLYTAPLSLILWLALASGLLLDGLTLSPALGFLGLGFVITCRLLYPWRLYLFKDSVSTLPLMTLAFSLISFFVGLLISLFFDFPHGPIGIKALLFRLFSDLCLAFFIFSLPTFLWQQYRLHVRRRRCSDDS
jgi:hypothetical protein